MPELPEVEVLTQQLSKKLKGLRVQELCLNQNKIIQGAVEEGGHTFVGKNIVAVRRVGKYLSLCFEDQSRIWFHLGMTGQLIFGEAKPASAKHLHAIIRFQGQKNTLFFYDIRKFGKMIITHSSSEVPEGVQKMAPDPFQMTQTQFMERFRNRTGRIKSLLMNQHIIAGLGNIYADESLYEARIHPNKRAVRVSQKKLEKLHRCIVEVLHKAVAGGGSSVDDFRHVNGMRGRYQENHQVYGRQGESCRSCQTKIRRIFLSGRSAHFCPQCQK